MNNFGGGFTPISYAELFGTVEGQKMKRENWGKMESDAFPRAPTTTIKRRKAMSVAARKRAKMTRGDELISDENARKKAVEILDQIQDTPGQISLDFTSPQTANLVPIPSEFAQVIHSEWQIDKLAEGQLGILLAQNPMGFQKLDLPKIEKGRVENTMLPRDQTLKKSLENLRKSGESNDEFVGFASAVANVLRKCDERKAKSIADSIAKLIEEQVLNN